MISPYKNGDLMGYLEKIGFISWEYHWDIMGLSCEYSGDTMGIS